MYSILYKYLIELGITNQVDIDGLLYIPLVDAARFCDRFVVICTIAFILLPIIDIFSVWLIRKNLPKSDA